ncbi:uncharacterized protein CC84DRAFT_1224819, partial [Paraphaeosphaeria sporulosa]
QHDESSKIEYTGCRECLFTTVQDISKPLPRACCLRMLNALTAEPGEKQPPYAYHHCLHRQKKPLHDVCDAVHLCAQQVDGFSLVYPRRTAQGRQLALLDGNTDVGGGINVEEMSYRCFVPLHSSHIHRDGVFGLNVFFLIVPREVNILEFIDVNVSICITAIVTNSNASCVNQPNKVRINVSDIHILVLGPSCPRHSRKLPGELHVPSTHSGARTLSFAGQGSCPCRH